MRNYRHCLTVAATVGIMAVVASPVAAQKKYDPGARDREIKIGNIMPYSGPLSAYGELGKSNEIIAIPMAITAASRPEPIR
jgi:hypothetical protein